MSLEDLVKASQRMTEKDFPQFDDPRVREVMAAAANLVEGIISGVFSQDDENESIYALKTALFAAQHSKPKESPCVRVHGKEAWCEKCEVDGPENCWNHRVGQP